MKMLKLKKLNEPEFDELFAMISDLKDFLAEDADLNSRKWNKNLNTILDFQDPDGGFKLLDMDSMPFEAKIDFCFIPTYICSAVLMKAFMTDSEAFTMKEKSALSKGLEMSCIINLKGHGYEALKGQIEAINIFMKAGVKEFLDLHPDLCPKFSEMMANIISKFQNMESEGNFLGPWNESYEEDIKSINEYFCQRQVFVYGTLMSGEANHRYLENAAFLGKAAIEGYDMYSVGWYPAVVSGDGLIIGEVYRVPLQDMPSIDMLEGEGSLYIKKCVSIRYGEGNTTFAFLYVYLRDCSDLKRIPSWKDDHVWYVSYGSNMLDERFLCYIKGGSYGESSYRRPCSDTTPPLAVRTLEIPYAMYFGNSSGSWEGCGVSFIDTTKNGKALGVAYLITKRQFDHVAAQENGGTPPHESWGWYTDIIDLGTLEGIGVKTLTNRDLRPYNEPCEEYLDTLRMGIRKNWPEMSDEEIEDYLDSCIR